MLNKLKKKNSVSVDDYLYHLLLLAVICVISFGTVFFHFVEKWNWLDSYYYSVVTLATVGYGDFVPKTAIGRFVATLYIFIGVGIIAVFVQSVVRKRSKKIVESNQKKTEQ
jgi:voltage-gated potassium channel